ncbi:hypothetical protein KFK09_017839 [Dendrobium nobile]|uniref:Uncharacterized protein n=1 Tax=Dendrobium nobile TaxID=94219 RepID=A0A8T3AU34_DENNO|nr:hypothetical protein KFK09_017839 [Dendrobium nobile]
MGFGRRSARKEKNGYLRNGELPPSSSLLPDPTEEQRAVVTSDPAGRYVVEGGEKVFKRLVQTLTSYVKRSRSRTAGEGKSKPRPSANARQRKNS